MRALGKGRDVRIHQNVIECFEDAAPPHGGGNLKMIVVRSGRPGVVLQGLSITGNEMRADRRVNHAIRVREYATEDLLVAENDIASSGRGIELQSRNGGAEIRGNEVSVGSYALRVAGSRNLGIVENTFTHTGRGEEATSVRLAGRVSGTIRDNRIRSTSGVPLKAAFGTDEGGSFDLSISGNEVTGAVKRIHS